MRRFWIYIRGVLCRALEPAEREAVMGDFCDLGLTDRRAVTSLLGLVLRRQVRAWKDWQPWFVTLAIILPVCPLLARLCTQLSMSVWPSVISWVHHGPSYDTGLSAAAFWGAVCLRGCALATWSWTSGFAVGALSRRTLLVSGVLFFGCYVVLANMEQPFPLGLCWLTGVAWLPLSINLLCVLFPAYCGIHHSSRAPHLTFLRMVGLALWTISVSALALWSRAWDQAAMDNWGRGGPALTLMQLTRHATLWNAGTTELLITAALATPIFYVLATDALGIRR